MGRLLAFLLSGTKVEGGKVTGHVPPPFNVTTALAGGTLALGMAGLALQHVAATPILGWTVLVLAVVVLALMVRGLFQERRRHAVLAFLRTRIPLHRENGNALLGLLERAQRTEGTVHALVERVQDGSRPEKVFGWATNLHAEIGETEWGGSLRTPRTKDELRPEVEWLLAWMRDRMENLGRIQDEVGGMLSAS